MVLIVAGTASLAFGQPAGTGVVSSTDLIENPQAYDGKEVTYRGEAVGDVLNRGESAWVTVNDDHYSAKPLRLYEDLKGGNSGIGVYGPRADMDDIRFLGSYTTRGDLVEVHGTFYLVSAEHGGDTCIVAGSLEVLKRGRPLPESRMRTELVLAAVLLFACVSLTAILLVRRRVRSD